MGYCIKTATCRDIALIRSLAERCYMPAYRGIHSEEQNRYMFGQMYSVESLRSQMSAGGASFLVLYDDMEQPLGYCAVKPYNGNEHGEGAETEGDVAVPVIYLDKLYLLPECKGRGLGRLLVEHVIRLVRERHPDGAVIRLDVNRSNSAKAFYEHLGFVAKHSWDAEIGQGYFMNACTMELCLTSILPKDKPNN